VKRLLVVALGLLVGLGCVAFMAGCAAPGVTPAELDALAGKVDTLSGRLVQVESRVLPPDLSASIQSLQGDVAALKVEVSRVSGELGRLGKTDLSGCEKDIKALQVALEKLETKVKDLGASDVGASWAKVISVDRDDEVEIEFSVGDSRNECLLVRLFGTFQVSDETAIGNSDVSKGKLRDTYLVSGVLTWTEVTCCYPPYTKVVRVLGVGYNVLVLVIEPDHETGVVTVDFDGVGSRVEYVEAGVVAVDRNW